MVLNYSSKHDISYVKYNNKNIPWKLNSSYISHNNQRTNASLNLGTINNSLLIESSQNNIVLATPQTKKVSVKNNISVINNLDVLNNLNTKIINANNMSISGILTLTAQESTSSVFNIIGKIILDGKLKVGGSETDVSASESRFRNVNFIDRSVFYDVSINNSNIYSVDFSYDNIISSYISNSVIGYDKSNNIVRNKAVFSTVSMESLTFDGSLTSQNYIKFPNNSNANNPIIIKSSDDYSKLEINKPLIVGPRQINTNISNISIFNGDISCNILYYSQLNPDIRLNNYFDISIGHVSLSGNSIPTSNIKFDIGSTNYKFHEIISTNYVGNLSGQATSANDLRKNLDMSFNNLDIYGTITLNRQNLNQFLSGDLLSINAAIVDFSNENKSVSDLSASLYSKAGFDLCLNTNFTLRNASFIVLNDNITSISASVYSKSDFDLCLNRNVLRNNDVSAIVAVVTNPTQIYPTLGYIDSFSNKVTNSKVTNELAFPYAITYIDDLVEDTNIRESYSYTATIYKYTITTTTSYISTRTTAYDTVAVANRQPNNVNLTRAVMVYARGDSALTPSREKTWSNTSASNTLPAVYVNVKVATSRSVTYQINTSSLTWEQHRLNAQQVPGRYLATILTSTEQTAATLVKNAAGTGNVWIGGRRRTSPEFVVTNTGGTITSDSTYVVHTFITSSTLIISSSISVEYLVVAGGGAGGGGDGGGGGGGAGGVLSGTITLSAGSYTITVGAGGASVPEGVDIRNNGSSSSISDLVVTIGGGGGGVWHPTLFMGDIGGSGGGSSPREGDGGRNGTPGQGFAGSPRLSGVIGGGGGGAGAPAGVPLPTRSTGAIGISSEITGIKRYYAGGGGGGAEGGNTPGLASGGIYQIQNGTYGGGNGTNTSNGTKPEYTDALPNTGGGGGGVGADGPSGAGGSGIVIIRYLKSATNQANVKTDAAWEWHNGDAWNYQNFIGGQPDNLTGTRLRIWGETWDDFTSDSVLPALYMTLQLQSYTNYTYEGNTTLLTWDNHKLKAQEVINRYLATIENSDQNTRVADCINSMAIDDTYKDGTGTYIGALRTSNSSASGYGSSHWQWSNGTSWSYSNFYRQGVTEQVPKYTYSSYMPQQPTSVRANPGVLSLDTIYTTNAKIPNLISSVNGSIAVTSTAIGASNLPASTTTAPIIDVGYPNTTPPTTLSNNNKEYTTTIQTYTTTLIYAQYNSTLLMSVTATGGNIITLTTSTFFRIHIFTSNGIFTPAFNGTVEVLIVGGGGGGGSSLGGGGGGGGVVYMPVVDVSAGQNYNIVIGTGGIGGTGGEYGKDGTNSTAFTAIAVGGGSSGSYAYGVGKSGGSGGGAAAIGYNNDTLNLGGDSSGNSLGINSGLIYGSRGGNMTTTQNGTPVRAAGGGGAGGQGLDTNPNILGEDIYSNVTGDTGQTGAGSGGVGIINNILGISHYWAGGGGGGAFINQCGGYGGFGGGGGGAGNSGGGKGGINAYTNGSNGSSGSYATGGAGGANTGGGGGGGSFNGQGGRGGDGIVIIRYLIQQPIGSFKISDNSNNTSNYIKSSASDLPTTIHTSYSCIAVTNDGMFVALGNASDVTVYMKTSTGWIPIGSAISVNFSTYTETNVGIIPTQFTENWRKNLQNLAINFNYFTGSTTSQLLLAFGDTRNIIKVYSYSGGSWSSSNGLYSVGGGSWGTTFLRPYNATTAEINNNNFGYFVTLSQSPSVLGFTVANKFYTYNCTNSDGSQRGSVQTLPNSYNGYTNIIAFKMSSDAEKIIVSNTYYVFIYKWNITDWTIITNAIINLVSAAITFTYPNTSTTPIPAGPRSLDISNISSDECLFAVGFPDKLIDISANRKSRGYVEYWKFSNNLLTRLATLVPRKRDITNSSVDTNEYFFSAGGIKITNANTILVAPNFKFHFNNNKNYTLATSTLNWETHNDSSNAKSVSGREMASIENEADNELVKITARNNVVWIGATRISNISTGITSTHWRWSDLSSRWNYTSFASGQPNSSSETRIQFASGRWYDTDTLTTSKAVYMTKLQYSLNTFSIFDKFYFHSSGFSSSYANTAISTTLIAKWMTTDTLNRSIDFKANGSIVSNGKGIFTVSDIRLKENIVDSTPKLEDLLKVRVVNYNLKGCKDNKLIGVVAQELEQIFPTLVNDGELSMHDIYLGKTESYKSVKYSCFDVILIKAFQEHVAIINKLTSQLDEIESKTKLLKAINKDYFILKQELDLLKSENELFKLNINEILKLI